MLSGTADVAALARGAPEMPDFKTASEALADALVLQVTFEIGASGLEARLPPGLHPTLPPLVTFVAWRLDESPWGAFTLLQTRIECRSGGRPRAFLTGAAIDNEAAGAALAARWGYRVAVGEVRLQRRYDEVRVHVELAGETVLAAGLRDPEPLAPRDVQVIANMNLARTPRGLRLVQVDPEIAIERAERGEPYLDALDAGALGDATIEPVYPVAATLCHATITLPALRYVCLPDTLAFQGTESVDG